MCFLFGGQTRAVAAEDIDSHFAVLVLENGGFQQNGEILFDFPVAFPFPGHLVTEPVDSQQEVLQPVVLIRPGGEDQLSQDLFYISLFSHHGKRNGEQVIGGGLQHQ